MIKAKQLEFSYDGQSTLSFPNVECAAGEQCLILGQSGCGKTTLLHLLGGLLTPTKGTIEIGSTNLSQLSGAALDQFRGRNIGIIFQQSHFIRSLTIEENLLLAQKLSANPSDKNAIHSLLEKLNIAYKAHDKADSLSQGEQQRAAIARALINRPKLILADEPTSALDDINCNEVIRLLEEQALAANAALLIVTHDARLKEHISKQIFLEKQLQ